MFILLSLIIFLLFGVCISEEFFPDPTLSFINWTCNKFGYLMNQNEQDWFLKYISTHWCIKIVLKFLIWNFLGIGIGLSLYEQACKLEYLKYVETCKDIVAKWDQSFPWWDQSYEYSTFEEKVKILKDGNILENEGEYYYF